MWSHSDDLPAPGRPLGACLRQRREALGLSQREVAARLGITDVYISRLELGKTLPSRRLVGPLAEALSIEPGVLERQWLAVRGPESLEQSGLLDAPRPSPPLMVPVIGLVGADPEAPDFSDMGLPPGASTDQVARPPSTASPNAYALVVKGESMTPMLLPGDVLVVDPEKAVRNGDLAIVRDRSGGAYVKAVIRRHGLWVLKSYNTAFPEMTRRDAELRFVHKVDAILKR